VRPRSASHAQATDAAEGCLSPGGELNIGDDGGATVSFDGGRTWSTQHNQPTAQFYHVTTDDRFPYRIYGAQQDNSTLCGPSRQQGTIAIGDWDDAGGGESGYVTPDPRDPDIVYAGSYSGYLTRKDMRTGLERNINAWPDNPMGWSSEDIKVKFQWTFPIVISMHDPKVLYAGGSTLFRSTNEGQSFVPISPPLARNDPRTLGPSGGPITRDQTGVETYGVVFALAESHQSGDVLWVGTDDGNLQVTRNAGMDWKNVAGKIPNLPKGTYASRIVASRRSSASARDSSVGTTSSRCGGAS